MKILAGFALLALLASSATADNKCCFGPVVEVRRVPCVSHWAIIGIDACGRRQTQFAMALADNPTGNGWSYQAGWRLVTQEETNGKWTIVTPIDGGNVKVETVDCLPR